MFINPKEAIQNGWIKGIADQAKQIQPNAIDFTLDKLSFVNDEDVAIIGESKKKMRSLQQVEPSDVGYWELSGGKVYDGTSDVYVEVPEGYAAILYTRSTFARNGIVIVSGLFDSGYKGHIGFTLYTHGGAVKIEQGTRVGQIAFVKSDSAGVYAGGYNHQVGTHYTQKPAEQPPQAFPTGPDVGQKVIPSDPRRTETGMGPLLGNNSQYL